MAPCPDLLDPPPSASLEQQWRVWAGDREAYRNCQALNAAKAATINTLLSSQ